MRRKATLKQDLGKFKKGDVLKPFYVTVGWIAFGDKEQWWSEDFVEKRDELFIVETF